MDNFEMAWDNQQTRTQQGVKSGREDCKDEELSRSSWQIFKDCVTDYLDVCSMHGLAFFLGSMYHPLRRILWFLLFTASFVWLMIVVATAYDNLKRKPVQTKMKVKYADNASFPTVTICNLNKYRKKYVEENYPDSEEVVRFMHPVVPEDSTANIDWSEPRHAWSLKESNILHLARDGAHEIHKSFISAQFGGHELPVAKPNFVTVETDSGVCFQFNPKGTWYSELSGKTFGLMVMLNADQENYYFGDSFSVGFKIALHRHDEEPFVDEFGFVVSPGQEVLVPMVLNEVISLPEPYEGGTCVDTKVKDFTNPLEYYSPYNYNSCRKECQTRYSVEQCGCKLAFDPGSSRICVGDEYACYRLSTQNYAKNASIERSCNCRMPCHQVGYDYRLSSAMFPGLQYRSYLANAHNLSLDYARQNLVVVRLYFEKLNYQLVEQVLSYDGMNFFADLGGNSGLCIGASLLTLAELIELIGVIIFNMIFRRREKTTPEKNNAK